MERSKLLTINQVAKILGVMPPTLRRWDKYGKLKAIRVGNKKGVGERRYRREDIIKTESTTVKKYTCNPFLYEIMLTIDI